MYVLASLSSPFHPPPSAIFPNVRACLYPGYASAWNLKLRPTFKPTWRARSRMFHSEYGSPSKTVTTMVPVGARSGILALKKLTRSSIPCSTAEYHERFLLRKGDCTLVVPYLSVDILGNPSNMREIEYHSIESSLFDLLPSSCR